MTVDTLASLRLIRLRASVRTTFVFLELATAKGVRGLGEVTMSSNDSLMAAAARRLFDDVLRDGPVDTIPALVQKLYAGLGSAPAPTLATAVSGLEQALYDILGRELDAPVALILGGMLRAEVPVYANINRGLIDRSPAAAALRAAEAVAAGFRAVKCAPFDGVSPGDASTFEQRTFFEAGVARISAIREAIGRGVELMVDCHGRFSLETLPELVARLRPFDLRWLEEPVATRGDFHAYAEIPVAPAPGASFAEDDSLVLTRVREATPFALAGGEFYFRSAQFQPLLELGALDVIMPDVKHCGGVAELVRIGELAAAHGVLVAPHNPSGPVSTLASSHAASLMRKFDILEFQWGDVPWRDELLIPPERLYNGCLQLPDGPGYGASLDETLVARHGIAFD